MNRASLRLAPRRFWLGMVFTAIALGLAVHELGLGLPPMARDFAGDALWAVMIFAWLGVFWPRGTLPVRILIALLLCWTVEASQAYHTSQLDALRATTLGQLVLGSGFDPRDLVAYAVGVLFGGSLGYLLAKRTA